MRVLFLFDLTEHASAPWVAAGHLCLSVDTQHENTALPRHVHAGQRYTLNSDVMVLPRKLSDTPWRNPDLIISFPPCTDLAVSGARHWKAKKAADPLFQITAHALARSAPILWPGVPYIIENPVGALSRLWRKADSYSHPFEYGGYLPHDDVHPQYPDYIAPRDAYRKLTGLWVGNGAQLPAKRPVECPKEWSLQQRKLGGKSLKTKNIRSASPRGLMRAIYKANRSIK
jgi:hypothetical protein